MKKCVALMLMVASCQMVCFGQSYTQKIEPNGDLSTPEGIINSILESLAPKYTEKEGDSINGEFTLKFDVCDNRGEMVEFYTLNILPWPFDGFPWKVSKSGRFVTVGNEGLLPSDYLTRSSQESVGLEKLNSFTLEAKSEDHATLIYNAFVAMFEAGSQ